MGLFDRASRVVRAELNDVVSNSRNLEESIEQIISEMERDRSQLRQAFGKASAGQKSVQKKLNQIQVEIDRWRREAELALQLGNEDAARNALMQKKAQVQKATALETQTQQYTKMLQDLSSQIIALDLKASEMKAKRDELRMRTETRRDNLLLNSSNLSENTRLSNAIERMPTQIDTYSQAVELSGMDFKEMVAALESEDTDSELKALKNNVVGSSKSSKTISNNQNNDRILASLEKIEKKLQKITSLTEEAFSDLKELKSFISQKQSNNSSQVSPVYRDSVDVALEELKSQLDEL